MRPTLRASGLWCVFVGGVVGTFLRNWVLLALPTQSEFPLPTLGVNIVGAFLLGLLLQALSVRGLAHGGWGQLRLLLGTGVLGGFTTYSALAAGIVALTGSGDLLGAALYGLGTVLVGGVATWLGIIAGSAGRTGVGAASVSDAREGQHDD